MKSKLLDLLSMPKYERLLPRLFPGAVRFEILDTTCSSVWRHALRETAGDSGPRDEESASIDWVDFGRGIERSDSATQVRQYRTPISANEFGQLGWLIVTYDLQSGIPVSSSADSLQRAFTEALAFLREELELQSECNQLAIELTERYEELNLVYNTKDQVEFFEEGHEALLRLVQNCADYLDVGLAALICRERDLVIHESAGVGAPGDIDNLLDILATEVYESVEAQVQPIVINDVDENLRKRILAGRGENLLVHPILDDFGTAIGILAVAARKDAHTFSNGDRNLLEVMAKKAARIIHTHHDSLTGLINRSGFESSLVACLASTRTKNRDHCLAHVNIDKLHVVNDLMGHAEGDHLIRRVAKLLRGLLRDSDVLARLDGDEFGILLSRCDIQKGQKIAEKLRKAVHELKVVSANRQLDVSVSVGLVPINRETESILAAMAAAEIACKEARDNGQNRVQVFAKDNSALIRRSEDIQWLGRVQQALRDDRFLLFLQPVMPIIDSQQAEHFEILLRMCTDNGEVLSPALFIPAAERYQLMPMVDRWVIRNTINTLAHNCDTIKATGAVFCINLSGQSLTNPGFLSFVVDELERSPIEPRQICFEITETAAISNIDEAMELIHTLRDVGCRFALDDFGAGLSSFGYLKVLPVDYLKIDGSFVREITTDDVSRSMVEAMCQIGRTMGLAMIAEFVGDQATFESLREIGVDYGQGFWIAKPAPIEQSLQRLREESKAASA